QGFMELTLGSVEKLIQKSGLTPSAIGLHGQTITHAPKLHRTWQIGDGAWLAEKLGLPVVWDFRTYDMRQGGEGAPLAPIYHQALIDWLVDAGRLQASEPVACLNIGGVANVSFVVPVDAASLMAFDIGPGGALLDDYMRSRTGKACDRDGALAAAGSVDDNFCARLLADPWFQQPPPRSMDRGLFRQILEWPELQALTPADAAASLSELIALSAVRAIQFLPERPGRWLVCGGGRLNQHVMARLKARLGCVDAIDHFGLDGDMLEAQAFAYLAARVQAGLAFAFPATTGVTSAHGVARIS
ncbi:MAG: anhydro-N-acetylmuramic acid kinase, partial [Pseudomonadota bacterium]